MTDPNELMPCQFKRGDTVQLSAAGVERSIFIYTPNRKLGVFMGYSKDGKFVKIIREGTLTAQYYHPSFWEEVS
jgi:hypothetical protein